MQRHVLKDAFTRVQHALMDVPLTRVPVLAIRNYVLHQSANQAGSLAFSFVLAMFPLLILVAAAAGYIGQPGDAAAIVERVMGYAPQVVQEALRPVVHEVLAQRNRALLAIGLFVTLWTASSGMQAVRGALNRSYGVNRGLPFWMARLKVTAFTVVVGSGAIAAFSSVVIMPYVWQLLAANGLPGRDEPWLFDGVRYAASFVTLVALYSLMYAWLPDVHQQLRTVLPGAVVGAALWVLAAATLAHTLRTAGKLALIYGGFAGTVATLIFLYASATTLIFGAEINAVLRRPQKPEGTEPTDPA